MSVGSVGSVMTLYRNRSGFPPNLAKLKKLIEFRGKTYEKISRVKMSLKYRKHEAIDFHCLKFKKKFLDKIIGQSGRCEFFGKIRFQVLNLIFCRVIMLDFLFAFLWNSILGKLMFQDAMLGFCFSTLDFKFREAAFRARFSKSRFFHKHAIFCSTFHSNFNFVSLGIPKTFFYFLGIWNEKHSFMNKSSGRLWDLTYFSMVW